MECYKMFNFKKNFLERIVALNCQCKCHVSVNLGVTALTQIVPDLKGTWLIPV